MTINIVEKAEQLETLVNYLSNLDVFTFDTETTGIDWTKHNIFLLQFSDGKDSWIIPTNRFPSHFLTGALNIIFRDHTKWVVGHNLKFDAHHLMHDYGVVIQRQWHDTLLMAYLLDENRKNGLKELMKPLLGLDPADQAAIHGWMEENFKKKEDWDFSKVPEALMFPYAAMDPFATFKLYEKLKPEIEAHFPTLYDTDRQVLQILWRLEQNGMRVDPQGLHDLCIEKKREIFAATEKINQMAGRPIAITEDEDLRKLFYEELKLPVLYRTKEDDKPAVNKDALKSMNHPIADQVGIYREHNVVLKYAEGLLEKKDGSNLVHGDYSLTRTKTGRFSCSDPNLQNVPKNPALRKCFVASQGWDMFYFDHAQIEMVGFAHYSKDQKMMDALKRGDDLHQLAASEALGVPFKEVTKSQRGVGKGTNFSIIYMVGKAKLANYISGYLPEGERMTTEEALQFKNRYFARFPTVKVFQKQVQLKVKEKRLPWGHFIKNQFGRVRRIEHPTDVYGPDHKVLHKGMAWTAINHLIQGWAPDLMKAGMVKIEKTLKPNWRQNVHDELRIDLKQDMPKAHRREMVEVIVDALTNFPQVRVPIKCKVEWSSTNWSEAKAYQPEV